MGIAWDLLVSVLITATVFALLGVGLDHWLGTKYAFKIASFLLMIGVGYRVILYKGRKIAKRLESGSDERNEPPTDDSPSRPGTP